jgi:hypothetical protein
VCLHAYVFRQTVAFNASKCNYIFCLTPYILLVCGYYVNHLAVSLFVPLAYSSLFLFLLSLSAWQTLHIPLWPSGLVLFLWKSDKLFSVLHGPWQVFITVLFISNSLCMQNIFLQFIFQRVFPPISFKVSVAKLPPAAKYF